MAANERIVAHSRKRPRCLHAGEASDGRVVRARLAGAYERKTFPRNHSMRARSPETTDSTDRALADGSHILSLLEDFDSPTSGSAVARGGERSWRWPRDVFIWFFLDRIDNVDTVKQTFEIELVFSARWLEPNSAHLSVGPSDERWERANFGWLPQLKFMNVASVDPEKCEEWFQVYSDPDFELVTPGEYLERDRPQVWVREFRRVQAVFSGAMDFHRFPFDQQLLAMTLVSRLPSDYVLLRFCDRDRCADMMGRRSHLQEFVFYPPRMIAYDQPGAVRAGLPLLSDSQSSRRGSQYSWLHIAPVLVRQPVPYMLNVTLPQLTLVSMVFATFCIPPGDLANRLQVDLDLVLATITFRCIAAEQIPKVAYLTWLDAYCLWSLFFLGLVVLENVAASARESTFEDEVSDQKRPGVGGVVFRFSLGSAQRGLGFACAGIRALATEILCLRETTVR
mmetsp:Transcript_88159/g.248031  ORF Transcript_88159/g.248031 Transcript_88159/m.248031 type:complete len:452 (+) Transcript_88159:92-1447(+)